MKSIGIIGTGKFIPEKIISNQDIVNMGIDTSDEWIVERTGIHSRHIIDDHHATSDMAYFAAKNAIQNAGLSKEDIDIIIVSTTTPDFSVFPSTACLVQDHLGLNTAVPAFDVSAACTGFNYALTTGFHYLQSGQYKHALIIGADCLTRYVDWTDRSVCILFGDGAGAVVLSEVDQGYGILASNLHADGSQANVLRVKGGAGSKKYFEKHVRNNGPAFIQMNGKAVFKLAVSVILPNIEESLQQAGITQADLDLLIPHQANFRIIDYVRQKLNLRTSQVCTNIERYGNTSSASIPIAIAEAIEDNKIQKDTMMALTGFGSGFTWGTNILKWGGF